MKRILNNRQIVFCALALVIGMILCFYYSSIKWLFYAVLGALILSICLTFFNKKLKPFKIEIIVIAIFYIVGFLYTGLNISLYNGDNIYDQKDCNVIGTVTKINVYNNGRKGISLSDVTVDGKKIYGTVFFISYNEQITHGEIIEINGKASFNQITVSSYAEKRTLYIDTDDIINHGLKDDLLYKIANHLKQNILKNVSGDEAGIMIGLLLGYITEIQPKTLANYTLSGINHIFSVSGLHIVFFSSLIGSILSFFKIKGFKNAIIATTSTVFYAGLCGFPVCAVRSVIMSGILNFVKNAGRKYDILNSIFLSLIIVLFIFPQTLFSYGLILSYVAVIGIAVFTKCYENLFKFLPEKIKSSLSVSFAVTTLMTPILFQMWGYTSIVTVFLNLLLVPIIDILYTLVIAVSFITAFLPFLNFLWQIPFYVAFFTNSILNEINVSVFTVFTSLTTVVMVIYYICAFVACDITNFKRPVKLISLALCYLLLFLSVVL